MMRLKTVMPPRKGRCAIAIFMSICAPATAFATDPVSVPVNVNIAPMAMLEFLDTPLLYLEIPPPASTPPASVKFLVTGNATATITAIPDAFVYIPGEGYMGKAVLNSSVLGYRLQVHFPRSAPGIQIATLPGDNGVGTPPLSVNLALTGPARQGELRIDAHQAWTPTGGMPALGVHVGEVILTLSAN